MRAIRGIGVVGEFKITTIPLKLILRNEVLPSYKNARTLCNEKQTFQITLHSDNIGLLTWGMLGIIP